MLLIPFVEMLSNMQQDSPSPSHQIPHRYRAASVSLQSQTILEKNFLAPQIHTRNRVTEIRRRLELTLILENIR